MVIAVLQKGFQPVELGAELPQLVRMCAVRPDADDLRRDLKSPDGPVLLIVNLRAVGKAFSRYHFHKRVKAVVVHIQSIAQHQKHGDKPGVVLIGGKAVVAFQQCAGDILKRSIFIVQPCALGQLQKNAKGNSGH